MFARLKGTHDTRRPRPLRELGSFAFVFTGFAQTERLVMRDLTDFVVAIADNNEVQNDNTITLQFDQEVVQGSPDLKYAFEAYSYITISTVELDV